MQSRESGSSPFLLWTQLDLAEHGEELLAARLIRPKRQVAERGLKRLFAFERPPDEGGLEQLFRLFLDTHTGMSTPEAHAVAGELDGSVPGIPDGWLLPPQEPMAAVCGKDDEEALKAEILKLRFLCSRRQAVG